MTGGGQFRAEGVVRGGAGVGAGAGLPHDENRIATLHGWIERLCDPQNNFAGDLNRTLGQVGSFNAKPLKRYT